MDQPPPPPHERPWRHPSELGPSRHELDDAVPGGWTLALATGAVAFVAVAVMLVAVVPHQTADPVAVSVTTTPVAAVRAVRTDVTAESARERLVALTRIPIEVSSAGLPSVAGRRAAQSLPDASDTVVVATDDFTYWLKWAALPWLELPEGSVVLDAGGELVGHVRGGRLVVGIDTED